MASIIDELNQYTFLTNSDAHSLPKIGREYQLMKLKEASFKEFEWVLHRVNGRRIKTNYGMYTKLGKYYTTICQACIKKAIYNADICQHCGSKKIVNGVFDRINELKSKSLQSKENHPPYIHQVPLEYIPKLGPK